MNLAWLLVLLVVAAVVRFAAGMLIERWLQRGSYRLLSRVTGSSWPDGPQEQPLLGNEAVDMAALDAGVAEAQQSTWGIPEQGRSYTAEMSRKPIVVTDDADYAARWHSAFGKQD